jgi:hypothetical protein
MDKTQDEIQRFLNRILDSPACQFAEDLSDAMPTPDELTPSPLNRRFLRIWKNAYARNIFLDLCNSGMPAAAYVDLVHMICKLSLCSAVHPLKFISDAKKLADARDRANVFCDDFVNTEITLINMRRITDAPYLTNALRTRSIVMMFTRVTPAHLPIVYSLVRLNPECRRVAIDGCVCVRDINMSKFASPVVIQVDVLASGASLFTNGGYITQLQMMMRCMDRLTAPDLAEHERKCREYQRGELKFVLDHATSDPTTLLEYIA